MDLKDQIYESPLEPGVYLFKDERDQVLYVGKAKSLRERLKQYCVGEDRLPEKTKYMLRMAKSVQVILTSHEAEALLLERSLIKHHRPSYNVLLTDDREYPYLKIDLRKPWPRLEKIRRRDEENSKIKYYGPFGDKASMEKLRQTIFQIFPLVRCSEKTFLAAQRPCMYYHIKKCLAPCCLPVEPSLYSDMIANILDLLEGRHGKVKQYMEKKMLEAADKENFELAVVFRDSLRFLDKINLVQVAVLKEYEEGDLFFLEASEETWVFQILRIRDYKFIASDHFILGAGWEPSQESLIAFLVQYYDNKPIPKKVWLSSLQGTSSLAKALQVSEETFEIPKNEEGQALMALAKKNAQLVLEQRRRLQNCQERDLEEIMKHLQLSRLPIRMEAMDVSHTSGENTVASCVVFIHGVPAKKLYRSYHIESQGIDDGASLKEAVIRRLRRGKKEKDLPDLLLMDGGPIQLRSALEGMEEVGVFLDVRALVKNRSNPKEPESILSKDWDPVSLNPGSVLCRIMTRLRDEAHRFALKNQRRRRSQKFLASQIDLIPGLGPVQKRKLFLHYPRPTDMKNASLSELSKIFPSALAKAIYEVFHSQ